MRPSPNGSTNSTPSAARAATGCFIFPPAPTSSRSSSENLRKSGLNKTKEGSWARVIVEKPFGTDLPSARLLNDLVAGTSPKTTPSASTTTSARRPRRT